MRKIDPQTTPLQLEEYFSEYGKIKSLKISFNSDHSSRRYGFVCFQEANSAQEAIKKDGTSEKNQAIAY